MLLTLERAGLISRQPRVARSVTLTIDPQRLPELHSEHDQPVKTSVQRYQGHSVLLPLTVSMAAWRCSAKCSKPSTGLKPSRRRSVNVALRKAASTCGAWPALVRA